ncbi:PREDICTED: mitoguardin-1 [Nanorana parkeri]|uniref:mitoguardin-1 n=1 Tax=Nanorana parkeri TaxID=125878 RepID=UPI000854FDF0|nr:PREDICTED: mitoguardin-1 [Nanorana parkeri]
MASLEDTVSETPHPLKMAGQSLIDFPLTCYNSIIQLRSYPGLKKILVATALGTISAIFLAHHFRRRRKKTSVPSWEPRQLLLDCTKTVALEKDSSCSSSKQNLTLSLNSVKGSLLHMNGGFYSKYSGSPQSLASVRTEHSCVCINSSSWDKTEEEEMKLVNIPVTTPENLYLMGMELFEEALQRWEQALTFRNRQAEDEASCGSIRLGAGDAIAEENVEDVISAEFIHKLEALLQRAYRLQEEFQTSFGASDPTSLANDIDDDTDIIFMDNEGDFGTRDTLSIASPDSFSSAMELADQRELCRGNSMQSLYHCPLYEEAMCLSEEGGIPCRALRTELLECGGDSDFLAKLHCIRQAFQMILSKTHNRMFLVDSGRKILSTLIVRAKKNPKKFEDAYDEMMHFLEQPETWVHTEMELFSRGVRNINFYDVFLDFIVIDSLEDLENPPLSIQNVVKNRWLNSSFKETAVTSSCWSVLKQKKQQIKVPEGFFAHFYAVCEHISPVLAWGFLGPRNSLNDLCCFYKVQVLHFLKDIFDLEKVCYSSVESLSEDILQCLQHRMELLEAFLRRDSSKALYFPSHLYKEHMEPVALVQGECLIFSFLFYMIGLKENSAYTFLVAGGEEKEKKFVPGQILGK